MKISLINRLEIAMEIEVRGQGPGVRGQGSENRGRGSGFRGQDSGSCFLDHSARGRRARGYSLIEILIATAITLLLMAVVVQMFGALGQSITDSRAMLESGDKLRTTASRLQMDLEGATVTMLPPRNPDNGEGYFEYIEGNVVQTTTGSLGTPKAIDSNIVPVATDSSVGDFDDILMFTTRSSGKPFVGLFNGKPTQSDVAEVAWFVRGRTLHRRQLLVAPALNPMQIAWATGFYAKNDISVRIENGQLLANTLGDLTRLECRFGHPKNLNFPFDARQWQQLGLPTLRECSDTTWYCDGTLVPSTMLPTTMPKAKVDFWANNGTTDAPYTDCEVINTSTSFAYQGTRVADDVILTNVIGFDVKAWDPGANAGSGGYVDLGYQDTLSPETNFSGYGITKSLLRGSATEARVYDTWSTHYENVGLDGLDKTTYPPGRSTNGFDDNSDGIVDNDAEKITSPPYTAPLRGIQVKIRIFEPDSRQIREITIVQDFLQK